MLLFGSHHYKYKGIKITHELGSQLLGQLLAYTFVDINQHQEIRI